MIPSNYIKNFVIGGNYSKYESVWYKNALYISLINNNSFPIDGYYGEITDDYNGLVWADTREFFFEPSLPIKINFIAQNSSFNLNPNYGATHIKANKINKTLINLNLNFNGLDDIICSAILNFFEFLGGGKSFLYKTKEPLENKKLKFICKTWNHTYKYYNNHDISATFMEVI